MFCGAKGNAISVYRCLYSISKPLCQPIELGSDALDFCGGYRHFHILMEHYGSLDLFSQQLCLFALWPLLLDRLGSRRDLEFHWFIPFFPSVSLPRALVSQCA